MGINERGADLASRQDLFSAILTGSQRIVSHDTFAELYWRRDFLLSSIFQLPTGFELYKNVLGNDFSEVVKDIKALQTMREGIDTNWGDPVSIMHLDNQQASIESRLYELGKSPTRLVNPALYCSNHAAYLCTYSLFTEVWASAMIPTRLTCDLLETLRASDVEVLMLEYIDLFTWIICTGGCFAGSEQIQTEFALLLSCHIQKQGLRVDETGILPILRDFIWSDTYFGTQWTQFWNKVSPYLQP